jgi:hypothetical protein
MKSYGTHLRQLLCRGGIMHVAEAGYKALLQQHAMSSCSGVLAIKELPVCQQGMRRWCGWTCKVWQGSKICSIICWGPTGNRTKAAIAVPSTSHLTTEHISTHWIDYLSDVSTSRAGFYQQVILIGCPQCFAHHHGLACKCDIALMNAKAPAYCTVAILTISRILDFLWWSFSKNQQ